jgi:endonuclease YncB( thermonuclease family)
MTRRTVRNSLGAIAVVLVTITAVVQRGGDDRRAVDGQVVAVIDGDTLGVMVNGKEVRVRLYGIDAPEKSQPYGPDAKRELSQRAFGRVARLESMDTDRYDRTIARVWIDGECVNIGLVEAGAAWWYRRYAPRDADLQLAEARAKTDRRGLWAGEEPVAPWDWRTQRRNAAGK